MEKYLYLSIVTGLKYDTKYFYFFEYKYSYDTGKKYLKYFLKNTNTIQQYPDDDDTWRAGQSYKQGIVRSWKIRIAITIRSYAKKQDHDHDPIQFKN